MLPGFAKGIARIRGTRKRWRTWCMFGRQMWTQKSCARNPNSRKHHLARDVKPIQPRRLSSSPALRKYAKD
jgi:hypothetical protein